MAASVPNSTTSTKFAESQSITCSVGIPVTCCKASVNGRGNPSGEVKFRVNDDVKKEILEANSLLELRHQLLELLRKEAPPQSLMPVVEMLIDGDAYSPVLPSSECTPPGQGFIHPMAPDDTSVKESSLKPTEGKN